MILLLHISVSNNPPPFPPSWSRIPEPQGAEHKDDSPLSQESVVPVTWFVLSFCCDDPPRVKASPSTWLIRRKVGSGDKISTHLYPTPPPPNTHPVVKDRMSAIGPLRTATVETLQQCSDQSLCHAKPTAKAHTHHLRPSCTGGRRLVFSVYLRTHSQTCNTVQSGLQ